MPKDRFSSSLGTVQQLARYNQEVFGRFERSLRRRPWAEMVRDRGTGHLSLKDTLVHILNVHEAWMVAVAQKRWEIFDRPDRTKEAIDSWAKLRRYADRVWAEENALLAQLTEKKLAARLRAPWMPGSYTLVDAFFQTTIEEAHHLGEIIAIYWQNNWRPPAMTWIENLRAPR